METCKQFALESSSSGCKFSVGGEDDDPEVIFMKPLDRDSKVPNKKDFFFSFSNNKTHLKKIDWNFFIEVRQEKKLLLGVKPKKLCTYYKFRYSLLTRDSQPLFHHQRSQVFGSNFRNFETHLIRKTILMVSMRCLVSNIPRDLSFLYRYFY